MKTRQLVLTLLSLGIVAVMFCGREAFASSAPAVTWLFPAVEAYGGVHARPDLPIRPDPSAQYKIMVDVIHMGDNHAKVADSLKRLARLVNLMAYAGVPRDHVHIVAVLDERAGLLGLTNAAYRQRFKVDNPNLVLLHRLKAAGVDLLVCSQGMAEAGLADSTMAPEVTVTLSALMDFAVFGARGYSYLQL
ncbi:MAG: DsrE family protein [Steroidobacteraceae bacterium]